MVTLILLLATAASARDEVDFNRDVRPILSSNCFKCHGPDARQRKAGLRFDERDSALAVLKSGARAIVPGKIDASSLWKRITHADPDERMPPADTGKKLTPGQIETLRRWIEQGAEYRSHWAYVPPIRAKPPRPGHPVDAFINARLARVGLQPAGEADRATLLRRLSLDLTGLPPSPEEVRAFVAGGGFEKQVDRLLASKHFGERMALYWFDLVRFADTRGYHSDNPRNVQPYRDYVIRAFNDNMPFDRFTIEQLAGDLLPEATLWQKVASGYNKLNLTTEEGGAQPKEYEAMNAADRVRNVSAVWMGSTMECTQCHDHKFDPFLSRDFYRMAAFFADIQEPAIKDKDPGIPVPGPEDEAELKKLEAELAALGKTLETPTPALEKAQAEWEAGLAAAIRREKEDPVRHEPLVEEAVKGGKGSDFKRLEDGSWRGKRPGPEREKLVVTAKLPGGKVSGLRLEVLPDKALAGGGPGRAGNGNFVLNEIRVFIGPDRRLDRKNRVAIASAAADFNQGGYHVKGAIDGKAKSGWAVMPAFGKKHHADFVFKKAVEADRAKWIRVEMDQNYGSNHTIGRFRLQAMSGTIPESVAPGAILKILKVDPARRNEGQRGALAAHYRSIAPALEPVRRSIRDLERKRDGILKRVPRMVVARAGKPRMVRFLHRGNWQDDTGDVMEPGVPSFMDQVAVEGRATRLDLAKWLVSRRNPLTARVFVNRLWKLFFGTGISKTLGDLGSQGEPPVHPELLDWLAVEFMESGWNVKKMVRLMVTSETYRRSSVPTAGQRARDPFNRLLSHQSRWRLDAEMVRDNALAISGLLVRDVGGMKSVKPYQPAGYWAHLNFPKRTWKADTGEAQYRRGIYTWWQRSFAHPSLLAFDAPNREECVAQRARSNTPQQALALLNDPTFVEAARVFAERIREQKGSMAKKLDWAYHRAIARAVRPSEVRVLSDLYARHLEQYRRDPKAAEAVLGVGQAPGAHGAEAAAWTSVARVILNLHETITRE